MTNDRERTKRYHEYLAGELKDAAQYRALAEVERDEERVEVFRHLAEAEMKHAARWAGQLGFDVSQLKPARRGPGLWLLRTYARLFGTRRVMPLLLRGEAEDIKGLLGRPGSAGHSQRRAEPRQDAEETLRGD